METHYTPKIEEFYIGFEYEELVNNIWQHSTIDVVAEIEFVEYSMDVVKVKYLDITDIKTLCDIVDINTTVITAITKDLKYKIIYNTNTHYLDIRHDRYNQVRFEGYIKNKSELLDILNKIV
jgi:hypothetical protein